MKKLVFLFFAFGMMQVSAQDLSSMAKGVVSSSNSMVESLAADQVKSLTKKLNLNEAQQEQASGLVVSQLKSEKFQKLLGNVGADKLTVSKGASGNTDEIQNALLLDKDFQNDMSSVLDDEQMKTMKSFMPK